MSYEMGRCFMRYLPFVRGIHRHRWSSPQRPVMRSFDILFILILWLSCGGVSNMMLVLSITFHCHYYIWGCMCSAGPCQFRWLKGYIHSSCCYHHKIGSINHTESYIFRGCMPEIFVASYSVTHCIYIPGKQDFVFVIIVLFMMSANSRISFGLLIVFVCLYITPSHYHHCANLSEDIDFIKCLSDIFCRVCE